MKVNDGIKVGVFLFIFILIMCLLSTILPGKAYEIVMTTVIITGCAALFFFIIKSKYIPDVFARPDAEQNKLILEYFDKIEKDYEKSQVFKFNFYLILFILISCVNLFLWFVLQTAIYFLLFCNLFAGIICVGRFIVDGFFNSAIVAEKKKSVEYEIVRVEAYDTSCFKDYRYGRRYYYVSVRYDQYRLKIQVPEMIYREVIQKNCVEGYLVKYPKSFGIFDKYDFVPIYKLGRQNE